MANREEAVAVYIVFESDMQWMLRWQKQGIIPDEVVAMTDSDKQAGRDPQKDRAYQILQAKIGQ